MNMLKKECSETLKEFSEIEKKNQHIQASGK